MRIARAIMNSMALRVLIADDDPNILKLFSRILSKGGYTVLSAESGSDALKLLRTEGVFDLLVIDLCMPQPDGFEVLKQVRSQYPGLRTLAVSGFLEGALLPASQCLGATASLSKIEAPTLLLSTVNNLIQPQ